MAKPREFGDLLTEAIHIIKVCEGKKISIVQDELGYALGRKGGSAVERWRGGHLPPTMEDRETLARLIIERSHGRLDQAWLEKFLCSADHPYPAQICEALFPSSPSTTESFPSVEVNHRVVPELLKENPSVDENTLTWQQVRDICADITKRRMATAWNKYNKDLFLQREKTRQAFEHFLQSDKCCFVLTGKSGVGKSNFLLALSEELQQLDEHICVLMYDGANIGSSVSHVITQDFNELMLPDKQLKDVWVDMAHCSQVENGLIMLCVDGINENSQAKELLRQLNELVQKPWPWLKILFSCRPEMWQTIKRGVRLAEALYYREEDSRTLGIALEPFTHSERIEPFSRPELPAAYAKYQRTFHLQTTYDSLPSHLRDMLRDPLSLWLVAKTYQGQEIPHTLKLTELIEQYVQALLRSERLDREDLWLLEKELIPLMVREGRYSNVLTMADFKAAGGGLYEALFSTQMLNDGRRRTYSFTNLLDTAILVKQLEGHEEKIAFKYERFYEYFVGKALFKGLGPKESWQREYSAWITELPNTPFLWGAVKSCLTQQLRKLPMQECTMLLMQLAEISDRRMEEILIAALTDYGGDEREKVQAIARSMLQQNKKRFRNWRGSKAVTKPCLAWKRIAINVALNLRLEKMMELALTDPSAAVRAVAIRHAFIYWCQQREAGFLLLENLIDRSIGPWGVPIPHVFESAAGLSLTIFIDNFKDRSTTNRLRKIWHGAIERLLHVNPRALGSRREQAKGWVRTRLLQIVVKFVLRTTDEAPSNSPLKLPELKHFFKRDENLARRRAAIQRIVAYMDLTKTNVQGLTDYLLGLVEEYDIWIAWLALVALRRHIIFNRQEALPLLKDLFDRAIEVDPPSPFSNMVPIMAIPLDKRFACDEGRTLCSYMIKVCQERTNGEWWTNSQMLRHSNLETLGFVEHGDYCDAPLSPIAREFIEKKMAERDYAWIESFIKWEVTVMIIDQSFFRFAFDVLELILERHVQQESLSIREAIIELLARVRIYYPDKIDDFMEINDLDEPFTRTVRTRTPSESIGDLLNVNTAGMFMQILSMANDHSWQKWLWYFEQLPKCRSLEEWFTIFFKFLVNEIYGKPIFPDAPK